MIQYQLMNAIQPFDGTVNVSRMPPPVQANYTTLRKWAEQILLHIEDKNKTAHKDYDNISSLYDEVSGLSSSSLFYTFSRLDSCQIINRTEVYTTPPPPPLAIKKVTGDVCFI